MNVFKCNSGIKHLSKFFQQAKRFQRITACDLQGSQILYLKISRQNFTAVVYFWPSQVDFIFANQKWWSCEPLLFHFKPILPSNLDRSEHVIIIFEHMRHMYWQIRMHILCRILYAAYDIRHRIFILICQIYMSHIFENDDHMFAAIQIRGQNGFKMK